MSGSVKILSLILVLQLALSFWIYTAQDELSSFEAQKELVSLSKDELSNIKLFDQLKDNEDAKSKLLVLRKKNSIWEVQISDGFTFKALDSKIKNLIKTITRIKRPLPVATSKISHKQLELTKENFNKKITLKAKNGAETLLLGKSAGFKQVYIRKANEDDSYSVDFDIYSLEFDPMKWVDTEFLIKDATEINRIKLPKVELLRKNESFILSNDKKAELKHDQVKSIFKALANLQIQSVVSNKKEGLKDLVSEIKFNYKKKDKVYSFYVNSENEYNLTVNDMPYIFTVAKAPVDKILGYKKDELLKVKNKENVAN